MSPFSFGAISLATFSAYLELEEICKVARVDDAKLNIPKLSISEQISSPSHRFYLFNNPEIERTWSPSKP